MDDTSDVSARLSHVDITAANQDSTTTLPSLPSPVRSSTSQRPPLSGEDDAKYQQAPSSPVKIHTPTEEIPSASSAIIENGSIKLRGSDPAEQYNQESASSYDARPTSQPYKGTHVRNVSAPMIETSDPLDDFRFPFQGQRAGTPTIQVDDINGEIPAATAQPLQYHHERVEAEDKKKRMGSKTSLGTIGTVHSSSSDGQTASSTPEPSQGSPRAGEITSKRKSPLARPASEHSLGSDLSIPSRSVSPQEMKRESSRPTSVYGRNLSANSAGRSSATRPVSMMDLLNIPHSQQMAHQMLTLDNAKLQSRVGQNASLLDTKKTLDMYRANVKKTNDNALQYEFALLLINAVQEASSSNQQSDGDSLANPIVRKQLLKEARAILQKLADRGYAYAQYYLGDGYASGFFNHGKPDNDKAFSLFIAAGKHGHAEASYRAALCYEFGWGSRRDVAKAVQYYRSAAAKGHPGAAIRLGKACLTGDMGLQGKYREGVKWLKRAAENADAQHNSGPYELGLLHIKGYGADVFKDESYAAQLLTQSADLGHAEANLRMGEVYEHGLLGCPKDAALSIHFYTGAAQAGLADAMMALCAWYMVGAEPVMPKDEAEAYEWAKRAADQGLAKAEYAIGYFTEMGIGCRRDPLEANTWYMKAAEQGDDRAKHRLAIIRAAESGEVEPRNTKPDKKTIKKKKSAMGGEEKDDKECIVM